MTEAGVLRRRGTTAARERAALGLLVGGLTAAVVLRTTVVPRRWHLVYNLGIGTFSVLVARAGGLGADDMGLAPARVGDGLRWGGAAFGAVAMVGSVGALAGLLEDDRTDVAADEMLWQIGVAIPLGTVVVEELAFRGALHGLLERVTTPTRAWIAGAGLFGLWHVPGAWSDGALTVIGTLAATTVAGLWLVWLRRGSGSLLAPALAHLGTNAGAFFLSWLAGP